MQTQLVHVQQRPSGLVARVHEHLQQCVVVRVHQMTLPREDGGDEMARQRKPPQSNTPHCKSPTSSPLIILLPVPSPSSPTCIRAPPVEARHHARARWSGEMEGAADTHEPASRSTTTRCRC